LGGHLKVNILKLTSLTPFEVDQIQNEDSLLFIADLKETLDGTEAATAAYWVGGCLDASSSWPSLD